MTIKLLLQAILKYLIGIIIIGLLLFIPAGTISFLNGWLFMGLLFIPMFIVGIVLIIKNPKLLKDRLNSKEKEIEQKQVIIISIIMFTSGFIIAGLNEKFNWTTMPTVIVIIASIIFIGSYILYAEVMRENTHLSRIIEVKENQTVIDTGLYRIIRHPMYMSTIIMFIMIPIILGSIYSLVIFLIYPVIIIKRIQNEEKVLEKGLKGYKEYQRKVKYRLIPGIW